MLDYDDQDTLERILEHHGVGDNEALRKNLATFGTWLREDERAKWGAGPKPVFPLVLLSLMGIFRAKSAVK